MIYLILILLRKIKFITAWRQELIKLQEQLEVQEIDPISYAMEIKSKWGI